MPDHGGLIVATLNPAVTALVVAERGQRETASVPVRGLVGYGLSAFQASWALVWHERQNDYSYLWLQVAGSPPLLVTQSPHFIADLTTTQDEFGNLYLAWTGGSPSTAGVFFSTLKVDSAAPTIPRQLTFGGLQDRLPSLLVHAGVIHLLYKQEFVVHAAVRYMRIDLEGRQATLLATIGETGRDVDDLPLLALMADGSAKYFWLRPSLSRGQVGQSRLISGQLASQGEALTSTTIMELSGHSAALAIAKNHGDGHTLVWLNNASGVFQAYHLTLDASGQMLEHGPVTQSGGHKFDARVHGNDKNIILFYEMHGEELAVMYTEESHIAKKPFAARLGLDPSSPFIDAFYTLASVMVGALALTALSALILLPVAGLLALLPPLRYAHYMALVVVFSFLLLTVAKSYAGRVLLPGFLGLSLMTASALVAWLVIYFARLDQGDVLTLCAFGHTYAYCLFFASLIF